MVNSSKQLPRKPSGDVEHHIVTRGPPLACRFRRLDGEKLAAAKKEFLQVERDCSAVQQPVVVPSSHGPEG